MAMPENANRSFRIAYDKLNEFYPPENTVEFANHVAGDFMGVLHDNGQDRLLSHLLASVYNYLSDAAKMGSVGQK